MKADSLIQPSSVGELEEAQNRYDLCIGNCKSDLKFIGFFVVIVGGFFALDLYLSPDLGWMTLVSLFFAGLGFSLLKDRRYYFSEAFELRKKIKRLQQAGN